MVAPEGNYCAIPKKRDPQNRSLYPSFHFKPVQFSKGPQNSHFQNFTTRHMRDPSPFPPWLFSEISEQTDKQTTDHRRTSNLKPLAQ